MKEGLSCFCCRWTASGDLSYLDQLEKIAFNAMPAPFFNGSMVCGKQHFPVVAPCLIKGLNICQDRLGTKLEKLERQGVSVQGAMKYFQETNHFVSDRYSQVYECCLTNHNMGWPK
jgi:hypothetical protein